MSTIRKPFFINGRFKNIEHERRYGFLLQTFGEWLKTVPARFSSRNHTFEDWLSCQVPFLKTEQPTITWVGHSTFLIQLQGVNILTDPIFFNLSTFFRRNLPPGIVPAALPPLDAILISHNHWDHMHGPSLMAVRDNIVARQGVVMVPEGDQHWFIKRKFPRVSPHTWGKQTIIAGPESARAVTITFLPAWHWSRRGLFDHNKSLWGSWMIESEGRAIYFAGDTAYADHFSEIQKAFPDIDIALLPIGPGEPKEAMKPTHVDAYEAGQAFLDLGAQHLVPMHWGTFNFGLDRFLTPVERMMRWWQEQSLGDAKKISVFKVGQRLEF